MRYYSYGSKQKPGNCKCKRLVTKCGGQGCPTALKNGLLEVGCYGFSSGKGKKQAYVNAPMEEYLNYVKTHDKLRVEDEVISVGKPHKIEKYQPDEFTLERTSVWSFPYRGDWATHKGDYRGN